MEVHVLSLAPIQVNLLAPAPNVTETEYYSAILKEDTSPTITDYKDLMASPLKVLTSHRGTVLYCNGRATVY